MKIKIDLADAAFSRFIRLRDGECKRCHSPVKYNDKGWPITHQASHFQGRRKEGTRFDPENVDCLCGGCHQYFTANPYEHTQWQIATKGQQAVDMIVLRSNQYCKKDRRMQAMIWEKAFSDLLEEKHKQKVLT